MLVAGGARLADAAGPPGTFRAVVLGLAATGLVGAFSRAGPVAAAARVVVAASGVAVVGSWGAADVTRADGPLLAAAALGFAAGAAPYGLAALGRALRCRDPGAGVVAWLVLVAGLVSLGWVDAAAQAVDRDARAAFRQAVLRVDLATAAAYDVARHDRFHEPEIYDTTTIASLSVELPRALPAAAGWTVAGGGAALLGVLVTAVRRRRAAPPSVRAGTTA